MALRQYIQQVAREVKNQNGTGFANLLDLDSPRAGPGARALVEAAGALDVDVGRV
jgi:hypothetical protein